MALVTVNLPIPAGNGYGAIVNVATLAPPKTIVIDGTMKALIAIEISQDGVHFAPIPEVASFPLTGPQVFNFVAAAQFMRTRIASFKSGGSTASVGAQGNYICNFISLDVPAGNGNGVATQVSTFGNVWTAIFGADGPFKGNLELQISMDGVNFAQVLDSFTPATGPRTATISAAFARVRRVGFTPSQPGPAFLTLGIGQPIGAAAVTGACACPSIITAGDLSQMAVRDNDANDMLELIYRRLSAIDLKLAQAHDVETGDEESFESALDN